MMSLLDDIIIFLSRLFWYLGCFRHFSVDLLNKESLPVRVINLSYFEEALLLEMTYHNKKVILSVIYRSPSQSIIEFDSFLSNLEKLLSDINNRKPALSIITGDFNARSQSWWTNNFLM